MKSMADVRVIDFELYAADPFGSVQVTDPSAKVIKLEERASCSQTGEPGADPLSFSFPIFISDC